MMDITVIDDCISESYQDLLEDIILKNLQFPWYFSPSITKATNDQNSLDNDVPGWSHVFINNSQPVSDIVSSLVPLAYESANKISKRVKDISQGRIFMLQPHSSQTKFWHVDQTSPHLVILYYLNNTDGDTYISEKFYDEKSQFNDQLITQNCKQISPKKGRCVIFDGFRYHHASAPTTGRRAVINFNINI